MKSKNCILILSISRNQYCETFKNTIDNTIIIYDTEIPDKILKEKNYCCLTETIKKISAWDKAIHYLSDLNFIEKYDYFYFIEDDVYTSELETFIKLFNILDNYNHDLISHEIRSQTKSLEWYWWKKYKKHKAKSYNPLCRLSKKILLLVIDYYKKNQKLLFHEVLFASIAYEHKLETLDFNLIDKYNNLFGTFEYRPIIDIKNIKDNKIYHPVKPVYEKI